ncbi:MAG TPA: hypothetical protein VE954_15705 [Oligoflexus sp.]|uniref:hypothetical protein n=1 Tax=Oligoflexus sp. TaxID=1971216 RepID=UPI002D3858A6|nr:hypothetical protein [Oligoflexus sp.]HYX34547.1 hypothetical protein [Oligoflexus sp.]
MNLEEIFCCLYDRRDRLADLMAANKETIYEKRRVKRYLDRSAFRGLVETSWQDGQVYYLAVTKATLPDSAFRLAIVREKGRISFTSLTHRNHTDQRSQDYLLTVFCIVAVAVLASVIIIAAKI